MAHHLCMVVLAAAAVHSARIGSSIENSNNSISSGGSEEQEDDLICVTDHDGKHHLEGSFFRSCMDKQNCNHCGSCLCISGQVQARGCTWARCIPIYPDMGCTEEGVFHPHGTTFSCQRGCASCASCTCLNGVLKPGGCSAKECRGCPMTSGTSIPHASTTGAPESGCSRCMDGELQREQCPA